MQIEVFTFNAFQENTILLYDETKEAVIIDPGCYEAYEREELTTFIEKNELKVVKLLNTHCHIDHVLGNAFVKRTYDVELYMHKSDEGTLRSVETYAGAYGFPLFETSEPDHFVEEGDTIEFGNTQLEIYFVPGHAPGHIAFHHKASNSLFSGDVLFHRGIGRYDLPGGDLEVLVQSIRDKMYRFPENTVVYCGHGPQTTIGEEKAQNPYIKAE